MYARKTAKSIIAGIAMLASNSALALLPFESTGNLYVSMWNADEIAVFTPEGIEVERFSAVGLDGPRGIAFNPANGEIWIAGEFSNAIYIFDHNHQLLRTLEHPDFNEPVGISFKSTGGIAPADQPVYISNSNGNEIMVFSQDGDLQKRFTGMALQDPNCSAFMEDGSLFVANRLGGTAGGSGAVSKFDANDNFLFDFTASRISSLMAVARDPNIMPSGVDDTIWATSGAGATGIYQFDLNGNLLTTLLPTDIDDGSPIVPQGIAFDGNGDFSVISFLNEVIKFDSDGNFIMRFSTGSGTARSTAFQGCRTDIDMSQGCVPLGVDASEVNVGATESGGSETTADNSTDSVNDDTVDMIGTPEVTSNSGGGASDMLFLMLCFFVAINRRTKLDQ